MANVEINLWLQNEIEAHAKRMACKQVSDDDDSLYANYGAFEEPEPKFGEFRFVVRSFHFKDFEEYVSIKIRDAARSYFGGE